MFDQRERVPTPTDRYRCTLTSDKPPRLLWGTQPQHATGVQLCNIAGCDTCTM